MLEDILHECEKAYDKYVNARSWKYIYLAPTSYDTVINTTEAKEFERAYGIEFIRNECVPEGQALLTKEFPIS